jgi:hypothetical protein
MDEEDVWKEPNDEVAPHIKRSTSDRRLSSVPAAVFFCFEYKFTWYKGSRGF